jgi:hypothetical protein
MAAQLSRQRVTRQGPQQMRLRWSSRKCRSHLLQQQQMRELPTREQQLLRRQQQRAR